MNERFMTVSELCTEVHTKIEMCGRTFKPDRAKAMFEAKICHSLPKGNLNDRGFTAQTLANSYKSAEFQLCDFDHRLGFYGTSEDGEDRVCGTIAAIEFPDKADAIELAAEGKAVPLRALLVAYRKAKGVETMLKDIDDGKYNWRTSVEVEYALANAALYDTVDKKFFPWSECTQEMKALVTANAVANYKGHKMLFIPGGEDGQLLVSGCAFTRWPADKDATLDQMAASKKTIILNTGWQSKNDYQQAIARALTAPLIDKDAAAVGKKPKPLGEFMQLVASLPPLQKAKEYCKAIEEIALWNSKNPGAVIDVSEVFKANPIIGHTDEAGDDKHKHAITKNMLVLPAAGHAHYMGMMSVENERDGLHLCGVTSCRGSYSPNGEGQNTYSEHCHTFDLGGMGSAKMSGVDEREVASMDIKERIKTLRDTAQTLATTNPAESKRLTELAGVMEKEVANDGVEEIIAARIKNGDLIPKNIHESAVATAAKDGEAKVRKDIEDAKKLEQERATTLASRMEAITKAKIDPKFAIGKDRTVESEVASIPVGPDGDKKFADRVEEWTTIMKSTGQMTAKAAAAGEHRPAVASTSSLSADEVKAEHQKKHGKLGYA